MNASECQLIVLLYAPLLWCNKIQSYILNLCAEIPEFPFPNLWSRVLPESLMNLVPLMSAFFFLFYWSFSLAINKCIITIPPFCIGNIFVLLHLIKCQYL